MLEVIAKMIIEALVEQQQKVETNTRQTTR